MSMRTRGFSLLEVLIAFAIMASSLGVLYRAMGASARQTSTVAQYDMATLVGESLLAAYDAVPPEGLSASGESAGLAWSLATQPYPTPEQVGSRPDIVRLHEVHIQVRWSEQEQVRSLDLLTLRPERKPPVGGKAP